MYKWTGNHTYWSLNTLLKHAIQNGLQIFEGILCSSFYVKEFDVIVHKKIFSYITLLFFAIMYTTSLANLVVKYFMITLARGPHFVLTLLTMDYTYYTSWHILGKLKCCVHCHKRSSLLQTFCRMMDQINSTLLCHLLSYSICTESKPSFFNVW